MRKIFTGFLLLFFGLNCALGQNTMTGPIVNLPVYFDVSPPLRDMVMNLPKTADNSWKDGIVKNHFNVRPRPTGQQPGGLSDPNLQSKNGFIITDTTIQNFDGNTNTEGWIPPDTHGDVGPNHYFQYCCRHSLV